VGWEFFGSVLHQELDNSFVFRLRKLFGPQLLQKVTTFVVRDEVIPNGLSQIRWTRCLVTVIDDSVYSILIPVINYYGCEPLFADFAPEFQFTTDGVAHGDSLHCSERWVVQGLSLARPGLAGNRRRVVGGRRLPRIGPSAD
jgi:hypothetical protein